MGAKRRFKDQFRFSIDYLALRHENASDFYLSCWQHNRSAFPLLCLRLILFLLAIGIVIFSAIWTMRSGHMGYWLIFLTQWGIITVAVSTGLGMAVSAVAYFKGPIDALFGLPWYVKLYWTSYNIALPLAFFITIFYYSFLTQAAPEGLEVDPVLDIFIHGVNSVLMFLLMATSLQPLYFLQFVYPFGFLLVYMTFSIIYYFAGGVNQFGDHAIYPMLDWANPGPAVGLVFVSIALIFATTVVAVLFTMLRDCLGRKLNSVKAYDFN